MLSWRDSDKPGYEYQCIKVKHLIEKGYFNNEILESNVTKDIKVKKENYIYLDRDKKTKTIGKKIILHDGVSSSFTSGLCGNSTIDGGISFEVIPVGKEFNGYSKSKKIFVYYNLYNVSNTIYDYNYNYYYDNDENIKGNNTFDKHNVKKEIEIIKNGNLFAAIKDKSNNDIVTGNKNISYIDRVGPKIIENYPSDEIVIVRGNEVVPIILSDNESGLAKNEFIEEYIKVFIGNNEIKNIKLDIKKDGDKEKKYNLIINDLLHKGNVKIVIDKDKLFDNLDNGNNETILEPKLSFSNEYKIIYDSNGGIGNIPDQICVYNSECVLSKDSFIKSGYKFVGWNTKANGSGTSYAKGYKFDKYNLTDDITLYAQWEINKVYINYNVNGGSVTAQTKSDSGTIYNWTTNMDGIVLRNGSNLQYKIDHNNKLDSDGLANWNNGKYLEIKKTGYKAQSKNEWKCLNGCTNSGKTYDQTISYESSDFCDTSLKDCSVVVGVNWVADKYKVTLNNNNATTSGTTNVTVTYDSMMPDIMIPTKNGYTFDGYYTNESAVDMISTIENYTNTRRINFINASNGWKMTNDDKGTHFQAKITLKDSNLSSAPAIEFNDIYLTNGKEYKVTGGSGVWTYFVDFDITNDMVSKRSYDYHTSFRFIDIEGTTANAKITVDMAVKGGKKYYSAAGKGLWNYDVAKDSTLYAKWSSMIYSITFNANGGSFLPSGYTPLEYIQSSGTQYVDTGYYWKSESIAIYFDGTVVSGSGDQSLFGNEEYIDTAGNRYFSGIPYYSGGVYHMYVANGSQGSFEAPIGTRFNLVFKTTGDKKVSVYKNGSAVIANRTYSGSVMTKANAYLTSSAANTVGNIFLFANHNTNRGTTNAALQIGSSMRIYSFRLIDDGQIVRNMIPAKNSSGVIGLYDSVTGVFYTNSGTGSFTAGPVANSFTIVKDTFSLPVASRVGYSFTGWNTKADGSGTTITQLIKGNYGNKTLYAQWVDDVPPTIPTYTAFFDDGSGNYTSGTATYKQVNTTISSTDKGSGLSYIQYCEYTPSTGTCGIWNTFSFGKSNGLSAADANGKRSGTEPWTVRQRNQYYRFRACDKNGNCSIATTNANPKHDGYAYNIIYNLGISGSVKISGETTYGKTLTANVTNPDSANLKYQWYSNSNNSTSGGTAISGATSSTYKIGSGLVGKYIYVVVTATKSGYNEAKWYDVTGPVAPLKTATSGSCATLTYTGVSQTLASGAVNATYSNNSGTNAKSYTVTVTANKDYVFSDGTTSKTLSCEIKSKTITITFYRNGAGSITPSGGSASTKDSISQSCDVKDASGCKIIAPKITGSTKTPTVLGWNTSANANSSSWTQNTEKAFTENATYYAQTKKNAVTYSITTNRNDDDATGTDAVKSCSIKAVYNGATQNTSCKVIVPDNPYSLTGNKFNGWTDSDYVVGNEVSINSDITLYAKWKKSKVYIKFSVNGGTIKSSTTSSSGTKYTWTTDSAGIISKNGSVETYKIEYGGKLTTDGLPNWSNSNYMKISKKEYTAVSDAEWKCLTNCAKDTYDHTVQYRASDFCDSTNGDCTVVLGVNWTPARVCYKVTADGGLNCRKKKDVNSSKVTGLSEGGYYMLKYSGYSGGYKWYYSSTSSCYSAGHNGEKAWLKYYGTSCPEQPSNPTPSNPTPSNPGTGTSCSVSVNECGNYCNANHPGTVVRVPGYTTCYCCPDDYYIPDPTTNPNCRFGWSC